MSSRKILLLYAGPFYNDANSQFHNSDCQALANDIGATDFLFLSAPSFTFNYTKPNDKVLWANWVGNPSNIPDSVFGTTNTSSIATIRQGMLDKITEYDNDPLHNVRTYTAYLNDIVDLAENIVNANSSRKLWFGLPAILPNCQPAAIRYNYYYKTYFYNPLKTKLTERGLWNNFEGLYYGTEDVVQWYTKFTTSAVTSQFNNVVVQDMKYISDLVHADYKKFLWIPYYRDVPNKDIATRVGHIVNKTNIFDIAIFQPNLYGGSYRDYGTPNQQDLTGNVNLVKSCVSAQKAKMNSGAVVGGTKSSNTEIGFEMEINNNILSNVTDEAGKTHLQRYEEYVDAFGTYITGNTKRPCAFYADRANHIMTPAVYNRIKSFFASGT